MQGQNMQGQNTEGREALTFIAVCGARLAPMLVRATNAPGDPEGAVLATAADLSGLSASANGDTLVLIYAGCADCLAARLATGTPFATALSEWKAEAGAVLATHRANRAGVLLVDQAAALAAPGAVLEAIAGRTGQTIAFDGPLAEIEGSDGALEQLAAQFGLDRAPEAQALMNELTAGTLAAGAASSNGPADVDALLQAIRSEWIATETHAAETGRLTTEAAALRDMLDHARTLGAVQAAQATRLAEQQRTIEALHGTIRDLERDLGAAEGSVRLLQSWLNDPRRASAPAP